MTPFSNALILPQLVHSRGASSEGDRPYLAEIGGPWLSYAEVDTAARRWAKALGELGASSGQRVAVMLPTSINSMLLWLACGWLRTYEVPIHVEYRGVILRHILNNSGADIAVVGERFVDAIWGVQDELQTLKKVIVVSAAGGNDSAWRTQVPSRWKGRVISASELTAEEYPADEGPNYWDIGSVVYTSGTTGPAKGVMVPWRQFYKHGEIIFPLKDVDTSDTFYCPLPLSHIAGRVAIYNMTLAGGKALLRERFSIEAFWSDIEQYHCTCGLLIGSIAEMLWRQPPSEADIRTPLRNVLMGPLIPQVEEFKARFGVRVRTQFGMTETTAPLVSNVENDWVLANAQSCGRVLHGFQCRVADENDEPLGPGLVGELLIRSDEPWLIMSGYWGDPENTAKAFRNQWFHTGDAFRYDADGNFYFVDRIRDTIRRRGENISTFFVEQAIAEHAAIAECAVVGVDSSFTEQEIHAFVVPKPGAQIIAAQVQEFLSAKLPAFMIPHFWTVIDALPRTATQRVRKVELRQLALAEKRE